VLSLAGENCNMLTRTRRKYAEVANPSWKPPSKVSRRVPIVGPGSAGVCCVYRQNLGPPFLTAYARKVGSTSPILRIFLVTLSLQATAKMHRWLIHRSSWNGHPCSLSMGEEVGPEGLEPGSGVLRGADGFAPAATHKSGRFLVLTAAALARRIKPCWDVMPN
jgi:hypothetical protein